MSEDIMFQKLVYAILAFFSALTIWAASAAAGDTSGFGFSLFPNGTPAAFRNPAVIDAAALSAIEPAAGGGNAFSATLETERKNNVVRPARALGPDARNAAAEKTRRQK
jgi:hypothetical protein